MTRFDRLMDEDRAQRGRDERDRWAEERMDEEDIDRYRRTLTLLAARGRGAKG